MGRRTFLPIFTVKSRPPKSRLVVSLAAGARFRFNFAAFRRREFMSAVLRVDNGQTDKRQVS